MSRFPLYDSLQTNLKDKDLTTRQKGDFIKKIVEIDQEGQELVFALIKTYSNNDNDFLLLPYDGKYVSNDIVYDLDKFPNKLKQLLYKFIKMHITKLREDRKRDQIDMK